MKSRADLRVEGHTIITDGIVLIDKDEGESSYGTVKKVKYALGGSKVLKVGHAGTLDPFATGLLIILVGQGTKLSSFIMSQDKVYAATVRLGVETDTLDPTGRIVRTTPVPEMKPEYIRDKALRFVGDIEQTPPKYSALKYKGTRAYKLARRGLDVDLQTRKVTVYDLRILAVDLPDVTMEVRCSSGTYIRSLASDLAGTLGTGGHLRSLRRLASGAFSVNDALCSGEIAKMKSASILEDKVIPLKDALPHMPGMEVDELLAKKVRHGYQPLTEDLGEYIDPGDFRNCNLKLIRDGELVAILRLIKSKGVDHVKVRTARVFS